MRSPLSTMVGRRVFMASSGGALLGSMALRAGVARAGPGPLFVGCGIDASGRHMAAAIDQGGRRRFDVALPGRGHGVAFHPATADCVVFARRPGTFAVVIDVERGIARHRLDAPPGRHFYGHGAFSADGRVLFTTENDVATGQGVVGIRDATDGYREIGAFPSHGIGPHELVALPESGTLAVANGGILTRPDTGRAKLNLDSMAPSLVFLAPTDGKPLADVRLERRLHQDSIRHLAIDAAGRVGLAMQYEGSKSERVPLVGIHDRDGLRLFEPPPAIERRMRHYAGSIAFDAGGVMLAATHPQGGLVTLWDAASGALLWHVDVADGCGVAAAGEAAGVFVVTSGRGEIVRIDAQARQRATIGSPGSRAAWDNHLGRGRA